VAFRLPPEDKLAVLLGIEVPSSDPVFLSIVFGVHIPLGVACVIAGATAMLSRKGRGRHATAGKVYFWCLAALFGSVTVLSLTRWVENYPLFLFGAAAFASALFGRTALRMQWPCRTRLHLTGMGLFLCAAAGCVLCRQRQAAPGLEGPPAGGLLAVAGGGRRGAHRLGAAGAPAAWPWRPACRRPGGRLGLNMDAAGDEREAWLLTQKHLCQPLVR
jgi:hypothetical protein